MPLTTLSNAPARSSASPITHATYSVSFSRPNSLERKRPFLLSEHVIIQDLPESSS